MDGVVEKGLCAILLLSALDALLKQMSTISMLQDTRKRNRQGSPTAVDDSDHRKIAEDAEDADGPSSTKAMKENKRPPGHKQAKKARSNDYEASIAQSQQISARNSTKMAKIFAKKTAILETLVASQKLALQLEIMTKDTSTLDETARRFLDYQKKKILSETTNNEGVKEREKEEGQEHNVDSEEDSEDDEDDIDEGQGRS